MAMAAARLTSHFAAFWPFFSPSPGFRFVAGRGIHRRSCALGQGMAPSRTIAIHGGHWVGRVSGWHVGGTDPICLQPMVLVYKKLPATGWFWDFGQMLVCIFQHHGLHILEHMGLWKRNGHIREHIHEHIISTVDAIKCWSFLGGKEWRINDKNGSPMNMVIFVGGKYTWTSWWTSIDLEGFPIKLQTNQLSMHR